MPQIDDTWIGAKHDPALILPPDMNHERHPSIHQAELPVVYDGKPTLAADFVDDENYPTEEEIKTLPRVADNIPWRVYTVAFVELCERFSYYGTTIVCMSLIRITDDVLLIWFRSPELHSTTLADQHW